MAQRFKFRVKSMSTGSSISGSSEERKEAGKGSER